jgi:hypothetical protein
MLDEQCNDAHSDLIKLDGRQYAHMSGQMYRLFLVVPSQRLQIVFSSGTDTCGLDTERTGKDCNQRGASIDVCRGFHVLPLLYRIGSHIFANQLSSTLREDSSDAFGHCTCLTSNTLLWVAVLLTALLSIIDNADDSRLFPNTSTLRPGRPG